MWQDGSLKVLTGQTSLSELLTVAVKRH